MQGHTQARYTPRSPGTHIVGSWLVDSISSYRDPRTGTPYIGNWASRVLYTKCLAEFSSCASVQKSTRSMVSV